MLDPKELRIGNAVQYRLPGNDLFYKTGKVVRIHVNGFSLDDSTDQEKCEGIPIAQVHLEACGFRFHEDPQTHQMNGHAVWGTLSVYFIGNSVLTFASNAYTNYRIEYVHQLQNLHYILTGFELEYNLQSLNNSIV